MLRRAEGFSDILSAQVAAPRCPDRVRKSGDVEWRCIGEARVANAVSARIFQYDGPQRHPEILKIQAEN